MVFVMRLPLFTNQKSDNYNLILVIIDRLIKMIYYELVKIIIDALGLAKIILDVVVRYHGLPNSIVSNRGSVFTSKFWLSLCYFLAITYFHTNAQIERQNSTIEAYLQIFVNYKQDNAIELLPIAKFAYDNTKNASTGCISFELNCGFYP